MEALGDSYGGLFLRYFYKPARTFLIARLPFVDLRVALRAPFVAAAAFFAVVVFFAVVEFFSEVAPIASWGPTTVAGATFSVVGTNPEEVASWKGVATAAEDSALFLLFLLLDIGVVLPVAGPEPIADVSAG